MGRRSKNRPPKKQKPAIAVPELPTFDNCDPNSPEEFALPAFVGLPGMKGAPLGPPVKWLRKLSKRLWDLGFRYHPELRVLKYRKPHTSDPNWITSSGEWVPLDAPDDPEVELSPQARQLLELVRSQKGARAASRSVIPDEDGKVPYLRADGATVMVTPAQAKRYAAAKRDRAAAKGGAA